MGRARENVLPNRYSELFEMELSVRAKAGPDIPPCGLGDRSQFMTAGFATKNSTNSGLLCLQFVDDFRLFTG